MKYLVLLMVFLLPFHALLITTLKCKLGVDTNILRFWKEILISVLVWLAITKWLKEKDWSLKKFFASNYLMWTIVAFIICSFIYIFFPYFELKISAFLWFKYDVYFLFAFIVWLYLITKNSIVENILKTIFVSSALIMGIFLPWYLFGDISNLSEIFWYSNKVSTYEANSCISFAQNVDWHHRFQWTFGWPIQFSVYLTAFYILYLWMLFNSQIQKTSNKFKLMLVIPTLFVFTSIFYSYSKTSILWLFFAIIIFLYLVRKIVFKKEITKKMIWIFLAISALPILIILVIKRDLFLHIWSVINRFDNLVQSFEMFFYNPIWYWLGIAWPASWIWKSIESAWNWQIAIASVTETYKFLPENWFVQILLEQWIVWLALFISVIWIIWNELYKIVKRKKDYLSISIFTAFVGLLFMWNFTHVFEESATSYSFFLIIWAYIWINRKG